MHTHVNVHQLPCEETSMKRLSSFGFTPLSKQMTEKRHKNTPENTSKQSTQIVWGTAISFCEPPQNPVSNATTFTIELSIETELAQLNKHTHTQDDYYSPQPMIKLMIAYMYMYTCILFRFF